MHFTATRRLLAGFLGLSLLAPLGSSQTGFFREGELLLVAPGPAASEALYRIDAATGHGELWVDGVSSDLIQPGWIAYDPHRDRALAYLSLSPSPAAAQLYAIAPDGTVEAIGFEGQQLGALAPVGDGRVYLNRSGVPHVLTADNELLPLLDASAQPIDWTMDHMVYDAPTNSLIGVSAEETDSPCFEALHLQLHRMPLDATGLQMSGPLVCSKHNMLGANLPVGLDPLQNGNYLIPMTGVGYPSFEVFYELTPAALDISIWSTSSLPDIDGGVYVPPMDRVLALQDNNSSDLMRMFAKGQSGPGFAIGIDVPLGDATSGISGTNRLADVEFLGQPDCTGFARAFGDGSAGTGGAVPRIHVESCPRVGAAMELQVRAGVGQGAGLILFSVSSTPFPLFGGTGYLAPPFIHELPFVLDGAPGAAGVGEVGLAQPIPPDRIFIGLPLFAQAGVLDVGAADQVALSNAVEITPGS